MRVLSTILFVFYLTFAAQADDHDHDHDHGEHAEKKVQHPPKKKTKTKTVKQEEPKPEPPSLASEFKLESNLVQDLYSEVIADAKIDRARLSAGLVVDAQLIYLTPTKFVLTNNYFDVDYTGSFAGVPGFQIGLGHGFSHWRGFNFLLVGRVGFGRKEALTLVRSKSGSQFRDLVSLNWIPVTATFKSEFAYSDSAFIKPFVEMGGGFQWISQSGKLDKALEQGFLVPTYRATLGVNLGGARKSESDWFGGVSLSGSLLRSFSSIQVADATVFDAGISFYL